MWSTDPAFALGSPPGMSHLLQHSPNLLASQHPARGTAPLLLMAWRGSTTPLKVLKNPTDPRSLDRSLLGAHTSSPWSYQPTHGDPSFI